MLEFDFEALSAVGLTPAQAGRAAAHAVEAGEANPGSPLWLARVTEVHRETLTLYDARVEADARALPRLTRSLEDQGTALSVGDWVLGQDDAHGGRWIVARVAPTNHLARIDGYGRRHPVVSNVDVALLVMGLDDDFNPRRLERYLALAHGEGIVPVAVLTKLDVATAAGEPVAQRVAELRERIGRAVDVLAVDATDASAATALGPYLEQGRTLVLLGSSGAGKSTLTNTLLGAGVQDTGPVRASDGRGMHTTTTRSMHRLPGGACIIDTPGIRTLRADGDEATLATTFSDIDALAAQCRFDDCSHDSEPGCAVRDAIDPDRLRNWRKLAREMARGRMTPLDRRRQLAQWKSRVKAGAARTRMKRGEA
jgi:ribosome biogenesis GTPase